MLAIIAPVRQDICLLNHTKPPQFQQFQDLFLVATPIFSWQECRQQSPLTLSKLTFTFHSRTLCQAAAPVTLLLGRTWTYSPALDWEIPHNKESWGFLASRR